MANKLTKRDLAVRVLEKLKIATNDQYIDEDDLQKTLRSIEDVVRGLEIHDIYIGYTFSADPNTINDSVLLTTPDWSNYGLICYVANQIAPDFGVQVDINTQQMSSAFTSKMLSKLRRPPKRENSTGLRGRGNRYYGNRTLNRF